MHALTDSKREKESNKFQKQLFTYALQNRRNFAIFTGKTCVGVSSCNFSKKRLRHKCFSVNITKKLRATFFIELLP